MFCIEYSIAIKYVYNTFQLAALRNTGWVTGIGPEIDKHNSRYLRHTTMSLIFYYIEISVISIFKKNIEHITSTLFVARCKSIQKV